MTAVGESDSSLATKCLDLCQTLAHQGLAFNFSLKIGSTFSFSLEARDKGLALDAPGKTRKKKSSPSTLRRNARRKEAFLQRKQNPATVSSEVNVGPAEEPPQQRGEGTFKCNICGNIFKSDNGLKIHKGKSHKTSELPQLEKTRDPGIDVSLNVSPVKDVREEVSNLQVYDCEVDVPLQPRPTPSTSTPPPSAPSPSPPVILKKPVKMLNGDPIWKKK